MVFQSVNGTVTLGSGGGVGSGTKKEPGSVGIKIGLLTVVRL